MMEPIVLFCKSYRNDLQGLIRLKESVDTFNADRIPFYISVPRTDFYLFRDALSGYPDLLCDEDFYEVDRKCYDGWRNQQAIKSAFWRLNLCENYLCLDSDGFFIRDFGVGDFLYRGDLPYTVCHEQRDLFQWSVLNVRSLGFDPRTEWREINARVKNFFGNDHRPDYDFGPSPVVFNCRNWRELDEKCLRPGGMKMEDLIDFAPSEFFWYGEWLLKNETFPIIPREPLFKVFHYEKQYADYLRDGHSPDTVKENFLGVVLNSNWRRWDGDLSAVRS